MGVPAAAVASAVPILAASRGKVHEKRNLHPHVGLLAAGKRAAPVVKMPCQRPNLGGMALCKWPSADNSEVEVEVEGMLAHKNNPSIPLLRGPMGQQISC
ncbi:unnamed protein product [Clonostachys rhizophaga]|uniref:Uncharacterized protein n=1 Tax=Clonostachys rhizophaga TaxID=160324 RepID=A0A9N9VIF1_9HYPO|nr:unnamed protein product [Clonostachys rhizophaga]